MCLSPATDPQNALKEEEVESRTNTSPHTHVCSLAWLCLRHITIKTLTVHGGKAGTAVSDWSSWRNFSEHLMGEKFGAEGRKWRHFPTKQHNQSRGILHWSQLSCETFDSLWSAKPTWHFFFFTMNVPFCVRECVKIRLVSLQQTRPFTHTSTHMVRNT